MSIADRFFFERFNENHDPDNGQFAEGGGSGGGGGSDVGKTNGTGQKAGGAKGSGSKGPAVSGSTAKGSSQPFAGTSPRNDQGSGRLKGATISRVFAPSDEHRDALEADGATPLTFNELGEGGAKVFHDLIDQAKQANKYGAAVTLYPEADYKDARLFVTDDGSCGFALKGDDIISVFKVPESQSHDIVASVLSLAVQEGGRRLDCFDTVLPRLYASHGFTAVARTPFDENYQPDGWDKELFSAFNGGKPDVVFMVHDENAAPYKAGDGKTFASYDDATHAQKAAAHAGANKAADLFDQYHDASANADDIVKSVEGASAAVSAAETKLKDGTQTNAPVSKGGFIQADGTYTPERQELHDRILNNLFSSAAVKAATPAAGEKPVMTLLGGRGGSGKAWFTRSGVADAKHAVYINSDDIQAELPGYEGWNAALYHDEASDITKRADDIARALGVSVIHDATMRTPGGSAKRAGDYKAAGYAVHGHYMFLPPQTSTKRAVERFVRGGATGRYVPASYLLNSTTNERSFDSLKGQLDKWSIYDNTGASPKLVAEGGTGEQEKRDARYSTRQVRARSRSAGGRRQPLFEGKSRQAEADDRTAEEGTTAEVVARAPYRARAMSWFFDRYNENHDPDNGQFAEGGGGGGSSSSAGSSASSGSSKGESAGKSSNAKSSSKSSGGKSASKTAPAASEKSATEAGDKRKSKLSDFEKAKINIDSSTKNDKARVDKFIDAWEKNVGVDPDAFKKTFTGDVNTTMNVRVGSNAWSIEGEVLDQTGKGVGTYTRIIDFRNKTAESAFFQINRGERDHGVGKKMLAGNVEMYQKMGIEQVKVHANIDVGGYAWARYGYVPTRESWRELSAEIRSKLSRGGGGANPARGGFDTYTPDSWDELSEDEQDTVKYQWMRDTKSDFIDSEISNWRDNGGALDDAKYQLAYNYNSDSSDAEWAHDTIKDYIEEHQENGKPVPFTAEQIGKALNVDYEHDGEGRGDPDISFDDKELQEPTDHNPDQMDLPGLDKPAPHEQLTTDMRDELTERLTKAFNDKADSDQGDIEPPDYLSEQVDEYQEQHWDGMSERERYRWARDNGALPEHEIENDEIDDIDPDDVEKDEGSDDTLMRLASSNNPKALWAIADSDKGKQLLLNSDWYGVLDLKDKETMDRFNAYVGKKKAA